MFDYNKAWDQDGCKAIFVGDCRDYGEAGCPRKEEVVTLFHKYPDDGDDMAIQGDDGYVWVVNIRDLRNVEEEATKKTQDADVLLPLTDWQAAMLLQICKYNVTGDHGMEWCDEISDTLKVAGAKELGFCIHGDINIP